MDIFFTIDNTEWNVDNVNTAINQLADVYSKVNATYDAHFRDISFE